MSLTSTLPNANIQAPSLTVPSRDDNHWNKLLSIEPLNIRFVFDEKSTLATFKFCQMVKRIADVLIASTGMLAISPLLIALALVVKLSSPGPLLYKSLRIGRNRKPFYMYKFRTMVVGADKQRDSLKKENKLEGELFKITNDPRITPIGAFLRKYSLDEFPQLWNVIKGDMSLVGPRPYVPDESALFEEPYTLRFQVQPGVTGMWQVSGRSNLTFQQLSEMDLYYTVNWSLLQDLTILLKTIPAVVFKRGAY